ncbi:hypothetical protein BTO06_12095 [Tenacibaculum sp. SZ-18]|uniref:hypothetical protein n=1 Tax=Tenacibaculum sp. SZ-18 TaxID=754423 RepID=UPI000C2CEF4D|nr:hypothetical protein [Tenacibaculum sp. SZ-18]AUC15845.1 hypothetical protein BTO06_12095 [Tenacibaculum sp. SZ-18]
MNRAKTKEAENLTTFQFNQRIKKSLALKFGFDGLYSGGHTIRNEKGWRDNEIGIDYIWITKINRSFVGFGGLITIKFDKSEFREIKNPEKLIQGIFLYDSKGNIKDIYFEEQIDEINDPIKNINNLELFTVNEGITLDGVYYEYNVITRNIETYFSVNNPNNGQWKIWEKEIWNLGNRLAQKSENEEMKQLFE